MMSQEVSSMHTPLITEFTVFQTETLWIQLRVVFYFQSENTVNSVPSGVLNRSTPWIQLQVVY